MRFPKRLPMKQWLKEKLDSRSYPGLRWLDKSRGKFEISWKHGSLETWNWEEDVLVFREWAIYTGKYRPHNKKITQEDIELAKTWKTNFRCALNALPGFEYLRDESNARGCHARKVYIMKPEKRKRKRLRKKVSEVTFDQCSSLSSSMDNHIDRKTIDEIEQELYRSTVFKTGFPDKYIDTIQDLCQYDELFHENEQ